MGGWGHEVIQSLTWTAKNACATHNTRVRRIAKHKNRARAARKFLIFALGLISPTPPSSPPLFLTSRRYHIFHWRFSKKAKNIRKIRSLQHFIFFQEKKGEGIWGGEAFFSSYLNLAPPPSSLKICIFLSFFWFCRSSLWFYVIWFGSKNCTTTQEDDYYVCSMYVGQRKYKK